MKTKGRSLSLILAVLFTLLIPIHAYAYTINKSGGYTSSPYSFRLHYSFSSSEANAMAAAAKAWEAAGKGVLAQKSSYTNAATSYPASDGYNNVTKLSTTQDYLALCTYWSSGNTITEADINMNPKYTWSTNPSQGQYDIQTVFTHELGHALGLGHSTDTTAIMKESFSSGEKMRTISADDIAGIDSIY